MLRIWPIPVRVLQLQQWPLIMIQAFQWVMY